MASSILLFRSKNLRVDAKSNSATVNFEGVAYTGGVMFPTLIVGGRNVTGPIVLDLESAVIPSPNRPVLDDHDDTTDGLIGRTTEMTIEGYQLLVKGVLYPRKERTQKILSAEEAGHSWQLSVGMDQFEIERVPANRSARINGQDFQGPLTVIRKAYLTDISFVSVGGDDMTWARLAARRARSRFRMNAERTKARKDSSAMDFNEWLKQQYPDVDFAALSADEKATYQDEFSQLVPDEPDEPGDETLTADEQKAVLQAARARKRAGKTVIRAKRAPAQRSAGTDGASTDKMIEKAVTAAMRVVGREQRLEAARCSGIDRVCGTDTTLATKAKADGWSVEKTELTYLRAQRSRPSGAAQRIDGDDEHLVLEAALLRNTSPSARLKDHFSEEVINKCMAKRFNGFSLVELADHVIRKSGMQYDGRRKQKEHMFAARDASTKLEAAGFTSLTLPSILENAADKVLLDMYQTVETVWQKFCAIRSVSDFKIHSQYALDPLNIFQKVGPQGDLAQLAFGDRKYQINADSYGARFKIGFQEWKNDDLGSINDRIGALGPLSASTIECVVFALLMAGIGSTSLFHASNNNYDATSASTFGYNGLNFAKTLWSNKVRQNGTPLGVSPSTMLVGTALQVQAGAFFKSADVNEVLTAGQTRTGPAAKVNPFQGQFLPTIAPYLNNTLLKDLSQSNAGAAIPHQNDATWMMFARQGNIAAMNIAFLDGQQTPRVEVIQNQAEMIGFELAASMHFGVGYGDPNMAACFNPNAA